MSAIASAGGARIPPEVVAPSDDEGTCVSKKRKVSNESEIVNNDHLRHRAKALNFRKTELGLRAKLQDRDQTISRLRVQNNKEKVHHQAELNKINTKHLNVTDKMEKEILRLKKTKNDLKIKVNERDERILLLQERLDHLDMAYTRPPVKQHVPTLVPDSDPKIRRHPEYKHAQAPRTHKNYAFFVSEVAYLPGEGKVWFSKYGSTKYWDLGLCCVRFEYGKTCFVRNCEYRHEPLTQDEQIYMGFLEPEGPRFLDLVRARNIHHLGEVLEKPAGSAR